jgi:hypothetical protein
VAIGLFSLGVSYQDALIAFRNGFFTNRRARAHISHSLGSVTVRIDLEKPMMTPPGQCMKVWIPPVSFWAFAQSHSFVVIS